MEHSLILAAVGDWSTFHWLWLGGLLMVYCIISFGLFAFGRVYEEKTSKLFFFKQISNSLERATGFPGWSMAGVLTGLLFLLIAVLGLYWDVAWHIDYGRDRGSLFTPSHVMILVGLGGVIFAAAIATLFVNLDGAKTGFRVGRLTIPWSAVLLTALGSGSVAAFPFDNLWHEAYGLDVTLWSPTHLQLLGGGVLATLALWLMTAEALPFAKPKRLGRGIHALVGGAALVGLTTFQGEFEFGVPQFQALYLPVLITVAGAFTLVLARIALGRWGAVKVVINFLVIKTFLAAVVGGALGHTTPLFALYLPSALAVEVAGWYLGTGRRLRFALGAGALVGTVGLVGELAWVSLAWPFPAALIPKTAVLAPIAAMAAGVLAIGPGRAFPGAEGRLPLAALAVAGLAVVIVLGYPLPRRVGDVQAVIRLEPRGDRAVVDVELDPPNAAEGAIAFGVGSWQGGGTVTSSLEEVSPGHYRSSNAHPITGTWKTIVGLNRGDQMMAAPVYLPLDPEIGAAEIPAVRERETSFVRNTTLLLREAHPGPPWVARVSYGVVAAFVLLWVALIGITAGRVPLEAKVEAEASPAGPQPRLRPVARVAGRRWSSRGGVAGARAPRPPPLPEPSSTGGGRGSHEQGDTKP